MSQKLTLADMYALASAKNGKCLSFVYVNNRTKLLWQCSDGHTWLAAPGNVKNSGQWCPHCCEHSKEQECRLAFVKVYGTSFPKSRPKWLRNSKGYLMELDGYSELLGVAFEYQGIQHYKREFLHAATKKRPLPTEEEFAWQQQKDQEKRELCKANGVTLIEVPWYTKNLTEFVSEVQRDSALQKVGQ